SNNQNVVLKRLTYITIALQIPVLVASIYGMNVPLPFQSSHYAFYFPVLVSLALGLLLAWYYVGKKRGKN
ncbi:MAG: magnesium transporter CorA family protein, partial [Bacteroidetes bacterium]